MRLEDLNWFDVENYLKEDDRLMLVLGSCEQHGYLSLLTDVKIPLALAEVANQQTGALVAPPPNFSASPYFLSYPGTFSLCGRGGKTREECRAFHRFPIANSPPLSKGRWRHIR